MRLSDILLYIFICMAVLGCGMTVYDKYAAKHKKRRVPERTLLLVAACGAALPMFIVMQLIRHKTRHKKFMIGLPALFLIHAAGVLCFYFKPSF
ncbi:MAG TPA: DUF1294 domain-containing protein [Candidatus Fimenecus stercoravium]|nr:DUF1294 domain-containing protein [Candidatus Fimenecus stercoravium]